MMSVVLLYMVLGHGETHDEFYFHGTAFTGYLKCIEYYESYDETLLKGIMRFGTEKYGTDNWTIDEIGCVTQTMNTAGEVQIKDKRAIIKQ